ncbi:hypothetical protein DWV46_09420 [Sellimonas intestinalis]|uniref:Uncharacterized protein n=1 Tax=Sellimonas intestinalis TaxID=1653434 RepID=A0A3E3K014_9FIRM|nr:hypothetical protein AXF09_09720 [Ruminococcus sp. DSM 100440]RGD37080.1 hypothetical protein DW166_10630 [Sellimonas intestinalis]RGE50697.1 hypothetical protein DW871_08165 [Sellimonas intestinalis]RGE53947.1 hypothetical protein DWW28_08665 [Sellimonas intestinalis]RGE59989.1 hypothetical protein DWV46_09420 [Sellimonas intestinalis]
MRTHFFSFFAKSLILRKTQMDKINSRIIDTMMIADMNLKSYSNISYHNEELKSLTRYCFNKVEEQTKIKSYLLRLVYIFFQNRKNLFPHFI